MLNHIKIQITSDTHTSPPLHTDRVSRARIVDITHLDDSLTLFTDKAIQAVAFKIVDQIHTRAAKITGLTLTLVNLCLTVTACVP